MPSSSQQVIVFYHGFCTDGFAAAYAAWKKFGDRATYIPCERTSSSPHPEDLKGKEVYILDYNFSKEVMLAYEESASRLVVIDHHISAESDIKLLKEYVFDNTFSGAYLAWKFFHPDEKVPRLIEYISDADTWAHKMPYYKEIGAYIYNDDEDKFTFKRFDDLSTTLETDNGYDQAILIGTMLRKAFDQKVNHYVSIAEKVIFDGHEVYAVNAPREVKSEVGHELAKKTNSFGIVFTYEGGFWKCSLRSVHDFDVSIIAKRFGGGGHIHAAAFLYKAGIFPLPLASKVN